MDKQRTVCVRNLRPRILRGFVGDIEYQILAGESADVDSKLAAFWAERQDVEILREKNDAHLPSSNTSGEDVDDGSLPSTGVVEKKKFSGFHAK